MSEITIGILCFVAGLVLGALIHRLTSSETARNRRLVQQLDQLQAQHERYQAEVSAHFAKSADLFSKINSTYRELISHMAASSERLAEDVEFKRNLNLAPPFRQTSTLDIDELAEVVEPPRDYAPKSKPEEKGTLAEDYGLDSNSKP